MANDKVEQKIAELTTRITEDDTICPMCNRKLAAALREMHTWDEEGFDREGFAMSAEIEMQRNRAEEAERQREELREAAQAYLSASCRVDVEHPWDVPEFDRLKALLTPQPAGRKD